MWIPRSREEYLRSDVFWRLRGGQAGERERVCVGDWEGGNWSRELQSPANSDDSSRFLQLLSELYQEAQEVVVDSWRCQCARCLPEAASE